MSCVEPLNSHRSDVSEPPQLSAKRSIARLYKASSTFRKSFLSVKNTVTYSRKGRLARRSKASVTTFPDLKDGALQGFRAQRELFVLNRLAVDPDGSPLYETSSLAVRFGKAGVSYEVHDPDLPLRQGDLGGIIGDAVPHDGIECLLRVSYPVFPVEYAHKAPV